MANEAAKKRVRENAARLRGLRLALAVAVALHAAFTFLISSRRAPLWHTALFLLCSLSTAAAYGCALLAPCLWSDADAGSVRALERVQLSPPLCPAFCAASDGPSLAPRASCGTAART